MNQPPRTSSLWRWLFIFANVVVCLTVLAAAVAAVVVINRTEPTAQKLNATRKSAALVDTVAVERGTHAPRLVVLGTVESAQRISLSPRVSGQVVEMAPEFVPGGRVREGTVLLRIDPADFENALSISESELEKAEASKEIELARQRLAEKELSMLEGSIDETNRGLVMREPQIAAIEAEVSAALASVDRAKLDLDRTHVDAPFDAQVLSRTVNIGSQVTPGDELGQLIGLDEYWVMAAVRVGNLRWVQFPEGEDAVEGTPALQGSKVLLRDEDAWGPGVQREARVSRMLGTLDAQTRLARILIVVDDPLGLSSDAAPLILNTIIETEIECRPIDDVVRLRREYVRDRDTVWLLSDGKLEIRDLQIVFRDAEYAYIREGLESGDEVVITTLATVAEGVPLRKVDQPPPADPTEASATEASP